MNTTASGYIKLGNLRKKYFSPPQPGEKMIYFDRRNRFLGNRHEMQDQMDPVERVAVIAAFKKDLDQDFEIRGPMFEECKKLAAQVVAGERIAAYCWCKGLPNGNSSCHGDVIIDRVKQLVREVKPDHAWANQAAEITPTQTGFQFD